MRNPKPGTRERPQRPIPTASVRRRRWQKAARSESQRRRERPPRHPDPQTRSAPHSQPRSRPRCRRWSRSIQRSSSRFHPNPSPRRHRCSSCPLATTPSRRRRRRQPDRPSRCSGSSSRLPRSRRSPGRSCLLPSNRGTARSTKLRALRRPAVRIAQHRRRRAEDRLRESAPSAPRSIATGQSQSLGSGWPSKRFNNGGRARTVAAWLCSGDPSSHDRPRFCGGYSGRRRKRVAWNRRGRPPGRSASPNRAARVPVEPKHVFPSVRVEHDVRAKLHSPLRIHHIGDVAVTVQRLGLELRDQ